MDLLASVVRTDDILCRASWHFLTMGARRLVLEVYASGTPQSENPSFRWFCGHGRQHFI